MYKQMRAVFNMTLTKQLLSDNVLKDINTSYI